ncbi:hypothetical protein H8959_022743 [Pygathrix nigripes]
MARLPEAALSTYGPVYTQLCSSGSPAVPALQFLSQHVLQIFLGLCAENHFHPGNSSPGHWKQQGQQYSHLSCWYENAEGQERGGGSKPWSPRTEERETSRAFPSPLQRQSASPRKGNMVLEIEPSSAQRPNPVQPDTGLKESETLRFGAINCRESIINIYQTSNDRLRGKHPCLGSVGEHQQKNGQSGTRWPSGRRSLFAGCMGKAFVITHHRETLHVGTLWSSAQMTFSWLTPQLLERT